MSKRKLTSEELDLWNKVSKTTEPLPKPAHKPEALIEGAPVPLPKIKEPEQPRIPQFKVGSKARSATAQHKLAPSISDQLAQQSVQMDKKAFGRMKRGKLVPEGKIDLHGMTLEQAHPALIGFVMRSYGEGKRLVLVITGKGKSKQDDGPIPVRLGVLKHQVPQWLKMAPLKPVVLQVSEAHVRHGGSGAYYVYLRRPR